VSSPVATRRNRTILLVVAGVIVAAILVIVAIMAGRSGAQGHYSVENGTVTIEAATIGSLGPVLVTDQGYALYMFPPDAQNDVTCTDRCAENWPPVVIPDGARVVAGQGVDAELLATVRDADGSQVASYNGWPLYTYIGDVTAGTATGQGQYLDGGYWYVIRPNGEVVKPEPRG
jgi:predicted lipoprotein with Yx(FWY)xxD motif